MKLVLRYLNMNKRYCYSKIIILIVVTVVLVLIGYGYYRMFLLSSKVNRLTSELASTTVAFKKKTDLISDAIFTLDQNMQNTKKSIEATQSQIGGVEQNIGKIDNTLGALEKLSKTDPELLHKYSKIFFLNEHYAPERLLEIDKAYLYSEKKSELIHSLVWPHLRDLLEAAKTGGITLYVKSAYRSFDEQKFVKSAYTVVYGKGNASQFSADQGYSEHQLGTTVDITTVGTNGSLSGFEKTPAYLWMQVNAHKYGFILSYPKNNKYYIFEPWHWRYVGINLATRLNAEGKYFYDLDQREIDKYLQDIFD